MDRQQPGPVGRGLLRRQRAGGVEVGAPVLVVVVERQRVGDVRVQPGAHRVGLGVGRRLEVLLDQRGGAVRHAGGDQRVGGLEHQRGDVDRVGQRGVDDELERLLEVVRGLLGTTDRHRLVAGADARLERGRQVACGQCVPGQLGGGAPAAAVAQRLGVRRVEAHPLARQQVVVDRLGEQRVPEGVAVLGGDHDVRLDRGPERLVERVGGHPAGLGEEAVGDLAAGDRHRADHLAGGVVEPVEADQQHLGEVLGDPAAPGGADELLDEERVALGPGDDVGEVGLGDRVGVQLADQGADLGVGERVELEPVDAADPRPLGDLAAQRVAAVEVLGAVADHDADRVRERPGEQEADHVARRLVGPVGVLDHQQQRGLGGGRREQRVHRLEQVAAVDGAGVLARLRTACGGRAGAGRGRGGRRRRSRRRRGGRWPAGPSPRRRGGRAARCRRSRGSDRRRPASRR